MPVLGPRRKRPSRGLSYTPTVSELSAGRTAIALASAAEGGLALDPLGFGVMFERSTLMSFAYNGMSPHRITSRLRSPALVSQQTTGSGSVGAKFQLGAMFDTGRSGGIEKTSLISLTSEERGARPHMARA